MDIIKTGIFIKELRKEANLTQDELAFQIGSSNKTISRWENGNYMPPIEMLSELSKIFNVSINELLSGEKISDIKYKEKAESNLKLLQKEASSSAVFAYYFVSIGINIALILLMTIIYIFNGSEYFKLAYQSLSVTMFASVMAYTLVMYKKTQNKSYKFAMIFMTLACICQLIAFIITLATLL